MKRYILRRVLLVIPTILGAGVLVFFLIRVIPGDICLVRWVDYGTDLDHSLLDFCRNQLGLNNPLYIQFFEFIKGMFTFDFGVSMWTGRPIIEELELRFALSLQVAIMAIAVVIFLAVPLGIISAVKQDTWVDYVVRSFSIAGIAMPSFWLGILIILGLLIGSQKFFGTPWMPPIYYVSPFEDFWRNMSQLIWPAVATGYRYSAVVTRMTRSALLEVLREDYIRTARAKGMIEKVIINRHALKNSMLPVLTIVGIEFAFLIGGLVVTEQVFNLNGLGRLFVESVGAQDFNLTQQMVMLVVLVAVLTNFVVDLIYAWLDPRIRYG